MERYEQFYEYVCRIMRCSFFTRVNDSKSCSYSFYEVWVRPVLLIGSLNGGADL